MANRALLVGINAYSDAPLRGCVNDVMDLRDLLSAKYGFAPAEIRIVTDAEATTANIRQQLQDWLLGTATSGDRLLFHFSGHGTQLPGGDGLVHDVICPADFDFTEQHALSDVDFSAIFKALPADTEFSWVSDSCHSGDLARALKAEVRPRYLPPPPAVMAEINALKARRAATRSLDGAIERLKGVLIAGCQSNETSADAMIGARYNGALSYYLLQELARAQGLSLDVDAVVKNVGRALTDNGYDQHPQIRGLPERLRKPFLGPFLATSAGGTSTPAGQGAGAPAAAAGDGDARAIAREGDGLSWDASFEEAAHPEVVTRGEPDWAKVHWTKNDADSPDYRHIAASPLKGTTFDFSADDLELLITANAFEPLRDRGKIIFGLRGAELVVAAGASSDDQFRQVGRPALHVREMRPDHQHFRCVIGVYDIAQRRLSGFIASTVPCRQAVYEYVALGKKSNMLPGGCYRLVVGPHTGHIGCLREDEDFTVLRTAKDYAFDINDEWDADFPADDLHPAFSNRSAQFSSWGCQTVRGDCPPASDAFTGEYKEFRHELGLVKRGTGDYGLKFSYVLLTGLEAAIAHAGGGAQTDLVRLRPGSRGERVSALQKKLGLPADGAFAAKLTKALADHQKKELGWADGIFSQEMDRQLKFGVFASAPAAGPAAPASPASVAAASRGPGRAYAAAPAARAPGFSWGRLIAVCLLVLVAAGLALLVFDPTAKSSGSEALRGILKKLSGA
jgi:hypothetical protein